MASAIARLAAYEDTGLGPEDIDALRKREQGLAELLARVSCGCAVPYTRLAELAQAEKDGRLVVLPCKVGDVVYAITSSTNIDGLESEETEETIDIFECTVESVTLYSKRSTQFRLFYQGVFVAIFVTLDDFGKTVFLTRAEAEAALKEREEAKNHRSN